MTHFHGIFYGNCALRYVGWVIEVTKLDFRGLIGKFDVKMGNFRGLIAKIGHLSPPHGPFSWNILWELCPKVCCRGSRGQKVRF